MDPRALTRQNRLKLLAQSRTRNSKTFLAWQQGDTGAAPGNLNTPCGQGQEGRKAAEAVRITNDACWET